MGEAGEGREETGEERRKGREIRAGGGGGNEGEWRGVRGTNVTVLDGDGKESDGVPLRGVMESEKTEIEQGKHRDREESRSEAVRAIQNVRG